MYRIFQDIVRNMNGQNIAIWRVYCNCDSIYEGSFRQCEQFIRDQFLCNRLSHGLSISTVKSI